MPTDALANPLVLPILGLLAERPRHAYALFSELRARYGYLRVRNATVYTLLDTLGQRGWVRSRPDGTNRHEFLLTPVGQRALADRVRAELRQADLANRTAFMTALAYLGILEPDVAVSALQERVEHVRQEEARLARALIDAAGVAELHMIEVHFLRDQLRHECAWLESTIGRIRSGALSWPSPSS